MAESLPPSVRRNLSQDEALTTFAGKVKLLLRAAGEIASDSGELVAMDPGFPRDARPFQRRFPMGRFPVVLTVARYGDGDERVSAAQVQFQPGPAVAWEPADPPMYGVDSGLACIADARSAARLARMSAAEHGRWMEELSAALARNYSDTRSWGAVSVGGAGNLVAFSSGFGDGGYASYIGLDARGRVACLLTDFGLLLTNEEIADMEEPPLPPEAQSRPEQRPRTSRRRGGRRQG